MRILPASPEAIREAVDALRAGLLVVLPTETVYGLAADATQSEAVAKIFRAKGRPESNPLIVHLADAAWLDRWALVVPSEAQPWIDTYWPGPLTLVVAKPDWVSPRITAQRETVAIRIPAHPVAHDVLIQLGHPVAAPSANRFMRLSPTRIEHIDPTLEAALALDGGPSVVGLESTVVDTTVRPFRILRQGVLSANELAAAAGIEVTISKTFSPASPGQHLRHYAPATPIQWTDALGERPGLCWGATLAEHQISLSRDPKEAAVRLYAALSELDARGFEVIWVERVPEGPEWDAIRDRLNRASYSE
ncbi:MAG TPA: L-threonylcarbamoyladenylate synthase [Fimbriimonadaceae bacterium]|nr:L-threonylcarbamoyladenylate synthase [Fimbriimonadaceae bacterium]